MSGSLTSVEAARQICAEHPLVLGRVQVPLERALGRVLARDVKSDRDLPPFDRAAVDGYAVRLDGEWREGSTYRVRGTIPAGTSWSRALKAGEAVRVMTGAPVPRGADGVVMVERSEALADGSVRLSGPFEFELARRSTKSTRPGLSPRGEDAHRGEVVVARGARLFAPQLAVLASVGATQVEVMARPRVALLSTGTEIVEPADRPSPAQIRNSNTTLLRALLARADCAEVIAARRATDKLSALTRAIEAQAAADVLVLTGGVSAGDFDFVPDALRAAGFDVHFHKVALRPGKPLLFATRGKGSRRRAAFGLPGNPVSTLVTAHEFVLPYLRRAAGLAGGPAQLVARMTGAIARKPGLTNFAMTLLQWNAGRPEVRVIPWNGSGDFVSAGRGNALLVLPAADPSAKAGDDVLVHPLDGETPGEWSA